MARDVVDLDAAVGVAVEALRERFGTLIPPTLREQAARVAVEAAADTLGLVGLSTVQGTLHAERRQHADPPTVHTDTVKPRKDYL